MRVSLTCASNAASVSRRISGTSPYRISTLPSPSPSRAWATACPVPFCSACKAKFSEYPERASRTCSSPWPTTTCRRCASSSRAVSSTWQTIGLPASRCSTLGSVERIRVPWPAARITTSSIIVMSLFYSAHVEIHFCRQLLTQELGKLRACHAAPAFILTQQQQHLETLLACQGQALLLAQHQHGGSPGVGPGIGGMRHRYRCHTMLDGIAVTRIDDMGVALSVSFEIVAIITRGRQRNIMQRHDMRGLLLVVQWCFDTNTPGFLNSIAIATHAQVTAQVDQVMFQRLAIQIRSDPVHGMALGHTPEIHEHVS